MKKNARAIKAIIENVAIKSAKLASGAASVLYFGQPKEPQNIKEKLSNKK